MKWPWQWGEDTDYYRNAYQHEHAAHLETLTKLHELQTQYDLSKMGIESLHMERDAAINERDAARIELENYRNTYRLEEEKKELTREDVYSELAVELDLLPRVRKLPPGMEYQGHSGHLAPQGALNRHTIAMLFLEAKGLLRQERELLDRMIGELTVKQDRLVEMAISRRLQIEGNKQ